MDKLSLTVTEKTMIDALRGIEGVLVQAGLMACRMQRGVKKYRKHKTGECHIDMVTEADLKVQEKILQAALKTPLRHCRVIAEEITPSVLSFSGEEEIYLTLDPIDGTGFYCRDKRCFSVIAGLQTKQRQLYAFDYFPAYAWAHRFVGMRHSEIGHAPTMVLPPWINRVIIFTHGDPEKAIPKLYRQLLDQGYMFKHRRSVTADYGSAALLLADKVAGFYVENPLAVDGLIGLYYAKTKKYRTIYGGGLKEDNFGEVVKSPIGDYYRGNYLVLVNDHLARLPYP